MASKVGTNTSEIERVQRRGCGYFQSFFTQRWKGLVKGQGIHEGWKTKVEGNMAKTLGGPFYCSRRGQVTFEPYPCSSLFGFWDKLGFIPIYSLCLAMAYPVSPW